MIPTPCPIRAACGGCGWMPRPLDEQRAAKSAAVARAVGHPPDAVVPSPLTLGYRARISLRPGPGGALGYAKPRTHEITPIPACAIARPEIDAALAKLQAALPDARGLDDVALRSDGARVVIAARARDRKRAQRLLQGADLPGAGLPDVALNGARITGDPSLELDVAGIRHRLGPETFYQVNLEGNALLVDEVNRELTRLSPSALLDAYSGAGNLSLPAAARGIRVTLLEREGAALEDARATAARAGLSVEIVARPAERLKAGEVFFDVALLDPPRAGAAGLIPQLLVTRPRALVYVSCNPNSLGRDLRPILAAGYRLTRLTSFDFFPHTPHVETLAVLER